MNKTKRPLSFLLAVVMIISMFAAVPFTASATTYSSGYIEARNLQVGDIITGTVEYADFYGYTIILKGGTYGTGVVSTGMIDEIYSDDRVISDDAVDLQFDEGHITICDYNDWGEFVPVANNQIVDAIVVLAMDGNTITLGGFDTNATFTVTWQNWDGTTLETDEDVKSGVTPTYDGNTPEKPEDDDNVYEFTGWSPALSDVSKDATYTATFTAVAKPKEAFTAASLTLDGNNGINLFISPYALGLRPGESGEIKVDFAWAGEGPLVDVASQSTTVAVTADNYKKAYDTIKVTCDVCAAEMTAKVKATVSFNGKTDSMEYSVREYCDTILNENSAFSQDYIANEGEVKYGYLVDLVKKMLSYGAKVQNVFNINTDDLADQGLDYTMQDVTSAAFDDAILAANGFAADDIAAKAAEFGASAKSVSVVFLSENNLRLYFAKKDDSFSTDGLTAWNDYYYAESANIAPEELDTLQTFTVSGATLHYSALDYAKALAASGNSDYAALAQALYWYNQAANEFFVNLVDLGRLTGNYTAQDGDVLSGTLTEDREITIAPGATVTLTVTPSTGKELDEIEVVSGGVTIEYGEDSITFKMKSANVVLNAKGKKNNLYKIVENCDVWVNGTKTTLRRNMQLEKGPNGAIVGVTTSGTAVTLSSEIVADLVKAGTLIKI